MTFRRLYGGISGCARRALRSSSFERFIALLFVTVTFLLAFYALALVHETIPSLRIEDGQDECPFCKLAHGLVLVLPALLCGVFTSAACAYPKCVSIHPATPHAFYRLRAPPTTAAL